MTDPSCELCEGSGTMAWQQPQADGSIRAVELPCPRGCGGHWKHPHAERARVVEQPDDLPARVRGNADDAQQIGGDFIRAALTNWGHLPKNCRE